MAADSSEFEILRHELLSNPTLAQQLRLEYLKWNPVGSLYLRHGFKVVSQNDIHFFLVREPNES